MRLLTTLLLLQVTGSRVYFPPQRCWIPLVSQRDVASVPSPSPVFWALSLFYHALSFSMVVVLFGRSPLIVLSPQRLKLLVCPGFRCSPNIPPPKSFSTPPLGSSLSVPYVPDPGTGVFAATLLAVRAPGTPFVFVDSDPNPPKPCLSFSFLDPTQVVFLPTTFFCESSNVGTLSPSHPKSRIFFPLLPFCLDLPLSFNLESYPPRPFFRALLSFPLPASCSRWTRFNGPFRCPVKLVPTRPVSPYTIFSPPTSPP